ARRGVLRAAAGAKAEVGQGDDGNVFKSDAATVTAQLHGLDTRRTELNAPCGLCHEILETMAKADWPRQSHLQTAEVESTMGVTHSMARIRLKVKRRLYFRQTGDVEAQIPAGR